MFSLNFAKSSDDVAFVAGPLFIDFASETEVQTQKVAKRLQWESVDSTQNLKT